MAHCVSEELGMIAPIGKLDVKYALKTMFRTNTWKYWAHVIPSHLDYMGATVSEHRINKAGVSANNLTSEHENNAPYVVSLVCCFSSDWCRNLV